MKKVLLILLLPIIFLFADIDKNTTEDHRVIHQKNFTINQLGDLGSFFEPILADRASHITAIISIFGVLLAAIMVGLGLSTWANVSSIQNNISQNKKMIEDIRKNLPQDIQDEVKKQIISSAETILQETQNHAYKKLDYEINQIKIRVQQKLLGYQQFIYQVNETKKFEYETILQNKDQSAKKLLERMIAKQGHYNSICNHYAPKLFSHDIDNDVIPTAENLSDEKSLHHIIFKYLKKRYEDKDNLLSYADKSKIKSVLKDYYQFKSDDFKN